MSFFGQKYWLICPFLRIFLCPFERTKGSSRALSAPFLFMDVCLPPAGPPLLPSTTQLTTRANSAVGPIRASELCQCRRACGGVDVCGENPVDRAKVSQSTILASALFDFLKGERRVNAE